MKIACLFIFLSLLISNSISAVIYQYTIRTSKNKIHMEVMHSCKKENIFFHFDQIDNWKKLLSDKKSVFLHDFERLVNSLKQYQTTGIRKYQPTLLKRTDTIMVNAYKIIQEINKILKTVDASVIVEEKCPTSRQIKNILADPVIYLPFFIGGATSVLHKFRNDAAQNKPLWNSFFNYSTAFLSGSYSVFATLPKTSLLASSVLAYARHT